MEQIQKFMTEEMNKLKSMSESEIKECIDEGFDGTYGKYTMEPSTRGST